jgi:pilus assembly protein Flp/PilA
MLAVAKCDGEGTISSDEVTRSRRFSVDRRGGEQQASWATGPGAARRSETGSQTAPDNFFLVSTTAVGDTKRRILMKVLAKKVQRFLVSEDGPTAVEYAVMLALIVIVCLTAIRSIGTNASATFNSVSGQLAGS